MRASGDVPSPACVIADLRRASCIEITNRIIALRPVSANTVSSVVRAVPFPCTYDSMDDSCTYESMNGSYTCDSMHDSWALDGSNAPSCRDARLQLEV
eukprot:489972-Pleurochrysis_carterae.AAC.2